LGEVLTNGLIGVQKRSHIERYKFLTHALASFPVFELAEYLRTGSTYPHLRAKRSVLRHAK
jgi:hypothetical protein